MKKLGQGTMCVAGPTKDGKGTTQFAAQRYGAAIENGATTICSYVAHSVDFFFLVLAFLHPLLTLCLLFSFTG